MPRSPRSLVGRLLASAGFLAALALANETLVSAAHGQIYTLKNDIAQIPLPSGSSFNAAIQVGFGPGEIATAVYTVPANVVFPVRITQASVLWYSQFAAILGPDYAAPVTVQDGFNFYAGSSQNPGQMTLLGGTDPIQLTDVSFNVFTVSQYNIIINNPVQYIACGLVFDTQLTSGDYNNQAPNGDVSAASVVYDRATTGDLNRNWIYTANPTPVVGGQYRSGWIKYSDLRTAIVGGTAPQGRNLILRLTLEHYTPPAPACGISDINRDGVVDGTDFTLFINSFAIGDVVVDPAADTNADGVIDGTDFVNFINDFAIGCP